MLSSDSDEFSMLSDPSTFFFVISEAPVAVVATGVSMISTLSSSVTSLKSNLSVILVSAVLLAISMA